MRSDRTDAVRTFATVRFMGGNLSPEAISNLLQAQPTTAYLEGEAYRAGPRQVRQVRKTSLWMLDTSARVASPRLSDHVLFVRRLLSGGHRQADPQPRPRALAEIVRLQGVTFDVSLFWWGVVGARYPEVDAKLSGLVNAIGGRIDTDFDVEDPSEDRALASG